MRRDSIWLIVSFCVWFGMVELIWPDQTVHNQIVHSVPTQHTKKLWKQKLNWPADIAKEEFSSFLSSKTNTRRYWLSVKIKPKLYYNVKFISRLLLTVDQWENNSVCIACINLVPLMCVLQLMILQIWMSRWDIYPCMTYRIYPHFAGSN